MIASISLLNNSRLMIKGKLMLDKDLDQDNVQECKLVSANDSLFMLISELEYLTQLIEDASDDDDIERIKDELTCQSGTIGGILESLNQA